VSEQVEPASPPGPGPARVDDGVSAFARLFAAHAAHVFEYCCTLTGSDAVGADATVAALASGEHLPRASHLLRARLFAIARQVATASAPAEDFWPSGFGVSDRAGTPGQAVLAVLDRLPAAYREVLVLVYRHGIWPEQLPAVLGVPVREAYHRLAAAEQEFLSIAAASGPVDGEASRPALEDVAALRLAPVPGTVWRQAVAQLTAETTRVSATPATAPAHAGRPGGSVVRSPTRPRRRLRLAAAAALPVAAIGCWAIANAGGSAQPVGSLGAARPALGVAPVSSSSAATPDGVGTGPAGRTPAPSGQGTAPARRGSTPTVPIIALLPSTPAGTVLPIASPTASVGTADPAPSTSSASPSPSPSPTSSSDSPSPSDSPSSSPSDASSSPSDASSSPSDSPSAAPSPSDSTSSDTPSTATASATS
jgi:DNA-directed RNA polymerase specialized sigma24 family protein